MTNESFLVDVSFPYLSQCLCQNHFASQFIDRTYSISVERLFDCIFGENDFLTAYRASRRITGSLIYFNRSRWTSSFLFAK